MQPGEHDPPSPRRTPYQHAAGEAKLAPESGKAVAVLLAELADLRERMADDRDRTADARDRLADSRDWAADARDEAADAREVLADQREQVASAREALLERLFRRRGLAFKRLHGGPEEAAARSSDSRARRMAVSGRMEAARQRDRAARKRDAASRRRRTANLTREHLVLGGEMADTMRRLRRQQQEAVARARIATARARSLRDSARAARVWPLGNAGANRCLGQRSPFYDRNMDEVRLPAPVMGSVPRIDTGTANVARTWNYMVGGKDNFEADREAARQLMEAAPVIRVAATASRAFLGRVVRYLAAEAGIRQFLDIGTGLPTAGSTHEVAQAVAPESRVVYVDNDPIVLSHARALLTSDPAGVTSYVDADARDPGAILAEAGAVLDLAEPTAVIMVDLLNFIEHDQVARSATSALMAAVAPGSYLAIMHPASDLDPALPEAERLWNQLAAQRVRLRSRQEVAGFLAGLELVDPGLVTVPEWRPDSGGPASGPLIPLYGAVARKP